MKVFVTLISSLVVGLFLASSNFSPIREVHHLMKNKRRFLVSAGLAFSGFIFVMAGIITLIVESALQYETQGFVFWSAMVSAAAFMMALGVFAMIGAKLALPSVAPEFSPFAGLEKQFGLNQILDLVLKTVMQPPQAQPQSPPPAQAEYEPQAQADADALNRFSGQTPPTYNH